MSGIKNITKLANQFYTKATAMQNIELQRYFDSMIREMIGLARGAEASVKHLVSLPKYRQSQGLQGMMRQLPELTSAITSLSHINPEQSIAQVEEVLNGLSFFTSSGNIGTGYDPAADVRESGYSTPSYYVNTLKRMVQQMKSKIPVDREVSPSAAVA